LVAVETDVFISSLDGRAGGAHIDGKGDWIGSVTVVLAMGERFLALCSSSLIVFLLPGCLNFINIAFFRWPSALAGR
jgi:hypothetical protein